MTWEIRVIDGMIELHLMAKHKAYYFTGSQNYYASLNVELITKDCQLNKMIKKYFFLVVFFQIVALGLTLFAFQTKVSWLRLKLSDQSFIIETGWK